MFGGVAGLNPMGCRNIASLYVAEMLWGGSDVWRKCQRKGFGRKSLVVESDGKVIS